MHGIEHTILLYLNSTPLVAYTVLFLGMLFEGDTFLVTVGFLIKHSVFQPILGFVVALLGVTAGDTLWYVLGTKLETLTPRFRTWLIKISEPLEEPLQYSLFRTLLISKFTYGFHRPLMVRVGIARIPFYTMLRANTLACALWIVSLSSIGFLAGSALRRLQENVRTLELGIFVGVVVLLVLFYTAHRAHKRKVNKVEKES